MYPASLRMTSRSLRVVKRKDYPFIKNKTAKISFRINDIQKIIKKDMFMLDKAEFLQWLSEPIKDNLRLGTKLLEIKKEKSLSEIQNP